jgi:L-2-hydroxyglutarate oxidase LhgO
MYTVDCVVVGAGIVGLSVARALCNDKREVLIIDQASTFGAETSARNSEVVHSGIYYKKGSLKAQLCVSGRNLLYDYCKRRDIPHRCCGKLIVAVEESEVEFIDELSRRGYENGIENLSLLSKREVKALEPSLACVAALLSPSTGIVDSHSVMMSLLAEIEAQGGIFAPRSPFLGARLVRDRIEISVGGNEPTTIKSRLLVNSAGLNATTIAMQIEDFDSDRIPPTAYAKGSYFALRHAAPFSHLIYPVPVQGGLGVHLTLDLAGQARFGPDVEWVEEIDYTVDPRRADQFYTAIRRYWPNLPEGSLIPAYAGIRPKLSTTSSPNQDFVIEGPPTHKFPCLVNLFGIESPGLTSALAIAEYVLELVRGIA